MNWRFGEFLAHCALGLVLAFAIQTLGHLPGAGEMRCFLVLLFPGGGWAIGWILPRGAPGASLAVAVWFIAQYPSAGGPTAKSLAEGFTVVFTSTTLIAEVLAGWIRIARLRRASRGGHDGA
ncbi:MAG: hypothetical protein U1F36_22180 [Planctomycetota bacterium]